MQATRAAIGHSPRQDEALFHSERGTALEYHTLWDRVRKVGKRVREPGVINRELTWSPRLFRRSYATALYKTGMKVKAIQNLTRHASLDVLVEHYIHDDEAATPYIDRMLT